VNDQGAGDHIAQPLLAASGKDTDCAYQVKAGQHIDDPNEVSAHRFEYANWPAALLDHSQAQHPLTGGLAVPEGLKEREVSPLEQKWDEDHQRDRPLCRVSRLRMLWRYCRAWQSSEYQYDCEQEDYKGKTLHKRIDQQGDTPAANACERELDTYQFRSLDAKLIPKIDAFIAHGRHLLTVNGMGQP
jgi:hypothetical protein